MPNSCEKVVDFVPIDTNVTITEEGGKVKFAITLFTQIGKQYIYEMNFDIKVSGLSGVVRTSSIKKSA